MSDTPTTHATPRTFDLIKRFVAAAYGVTVPCIDSRLRTARLALARQHAMALAREALVQIDQTAIPHRLAPVAHAKIAAAFNRDDHGTSIHAGHVVAKKRETDSNFYLRDSILREAIRDRLAKQ